MKYFEYIDLPDLENIQSQVLKNIPEDLKRPTVTFTKTQRPELFDVFRNIPELKTFLKNKNWYEHLIDFTLYTMDGESNFDIHIDTPDPKYNCVRLLVPIQGCDNTYTQFYNAIGEPEIHWIKTEHGDPQPFKKFKKEDCEFVTQAEMTQPFLIHHQPPHGIYNPNKNWRISLWIDFDSKIDLLQYISDFED